MSKYKTECHQADIIPWMGIQDKPLMCSECGEYVTPTGYLKEPVP